MKLYKLLIGGLSLMAVVHFTSCNKLDTLPTDRFTDEIFGTTPTMRKKWSTWPIIKCIPQTVCGTTKP